MNCTVPTQLTSGGSGGGIWFLANPVDGEWHVQEDGELSCRSESALTDFRFLIIESDVAAPLPFQLMSLGRVQGLFRLRLIGESGRQYAIEVSENLQNWIPLTTNVAGDGTFDFADTNAGASAFCATRISA
jgi:hypothetical protein